MPKITDYPVGDAASGFHLLGVDGNGNVKRFSKTQLQTVLGTSGTVTPPPDVPVTAAPVNTVLPAITGTVSVGSTLTTSTGTWTGNPTPTYAYQWRRGSSDIAGANAPSYVLTQSDVDWAISCRVTASNSVSSVAAVSAATEVVQSDLLIAPQLVTPPLAAGVPAEGEQATLTQAVWSEVAVPPTNLTKPVVTGQPYSGQTLTTTNGTWTGTGTLTYARAWKRNGVAVSGATGLTYALTSADVGTVITVAVTATSTYGGATSTSDPTATIAVPAVVPVNTTLPAISGTAAVGQTLTVASTGGGLIDPANLATTAVITLNEEWNALDLRTTANPNGRWATGYHWYPAAGGSLNGAMELQWYIQKDYAPTASLVPWTVANGTLSIKAQLTPDNMKQHISNYAYYSGMLTTYYTFSQPRGYWEMRAKLPATKGFWPAFWLMPNDGSWPPEIDIMEYMSQDPTHYVASTHWTENGHQIESITHPTPDLSAAFHTYGVRITDTQITYYFDGQSIGSRDMKPGMAGKSWYTLINLAVGGWNGNFPDGTSVLPANYEVEYFRAYVASSATPGVWTNNPTSFTYQWKRSGVNISGATALTYVVQQADVGATLTCSVVAVNASGPSTAVTSAASATVPAPVTSSTFDALYKGADIALTNNNLTATCTTNYNNGANSVYGTVGRAQPTSDKLATFTIHADTNNSRFFVGLATKATPLGYAPLANADQPAVGYNRAGASASIFYPDPAGGGTEAPAVTALAAGQTVRFRLNGTDVWVSLNGAAETGPYWIKSGTAEVFPIFFGDMAGASVTVNTSQW